MEWLRLVLPYVLTLLDLHWSGYLLLVLAYSMAQASQAELHSPLIPVLESSVLVVKSCSVTESFDCILSITYAVFV